MKNALIVVDVQRDFCPGGALAVPDGDKIVPVINKLLTKYRLTWELFFTRDWHPAVTKHFDKWPPHCVEGTPGAEFQPDLLVPRKSLFGTEFFKGRGPDADGYNGLEALDGDPACCSALTLHDHLMHRRVRNVWICGLALEYCVKATAIASAKAGFRTYLIQNATKGVNLTPRDVPDALFEMSEAGVGMVTSANLIAEKGEL